MGEDSGGPGHRLPALDVLLLEAKVSVPPSRPGIVSRAALIETALASDCRVVGVTAPAGYGKSTFLAEWARVEDRPVVWVTLDRFDDDPAALCVAGPTHPKRPCAPSAEARLEQITTARPTGCCGRC